MTETKLHSKGHKLNAVVTGAFFIAATVSAIIGVLLYGPVLNNTDSLASGAGNSTRIAAGAFFELILAFSAVGTGIMLFPYIRRYNESWGLGYVCFRVLEVVFIVIGIISMLSLLTLGQEYVKLNGQDAASMQSVAKLLIAIHSWTFSLGPHFMLGINTFIYSYILYRSKLVPIKLAIYGITAAVLIFIAALLEIYGINSPFSVQTAVLALPIAVYEMVLAGWLIVRGFNEYALAQLFQNQATNR
ncbi:MAG: DUF4386 domain-containing protein [Bacteroidales bacterium]|nr:DUF4386 domain-containing protein [Bacteroidales bacterium]